MEPDEVLGNEPNTPDVSDKGQGKDEYVPLTRAQAESLQRQVDESRESERYWSAHARNNGQQQQAEPEAEDGSEFYDEETATEGNTPEKFVDDLASTGAAAIGKAGYVTKAEAQRIAADTAARVSREFIGRERQKMGSDTKILADFPELKDQNSDLYKETAKHYQEAVAMDPNAVKSPVALYLAAKTARATLKAKAAPRRDDDDDRPEPESDRRARANSQDGRAKGRAEVEDDDMLGSEARSIVKSMGITEAEFKASRKETAGAGRRR